MNVVVRDAAMHDIPDVAAIYAHYVLNSLATFDEIPPDEAEFAQRRVNLAAASMPFLVAADKTGTVLGFAYAAFFRARPAYRYAVEDSIYVRRDAVRQGIGRALLAELIERCGAAGFRQMIAVIGDSANAASIGLHERAGFRRAGLLGDVGFKFGRWVDAVLMQRALEHGASQAPGSSTLDA